MCGRLRLENDYSETKIVWIPDGHPAINYSQHFNGAPSQDFPIVRYDPEAKARSRLSRMILPNFASYAPRSCHTFAPGMPKSAPRLDPFSMG